MDKERYKSTERKEVILCELFLLEMWILMESSLERGFSFMCL